MPLPVSGAISFNDINVELGVAGTTQASLNQASYRTLAGVPSGAISMSDFYGKANQFNLTISSNQTNVNLATFATSAGWNGTTKLIATINSDVYVSSNSTGTPALTVSGSFPNGVELINNGFIIGMGGGGGGRDSTVFGQPAVAGGGAGGALSVSSAISINNAGTIAGGGGGGGQGGDSFNDVSAAGYFGGGGGGGRSSAAANSAGGASRNGAGNGAPGTVSAAGAGGLGVVSPSGPFGPRPSGGFGGDWGTSGVTGQSGNYSSGASGGAAGYAISGNSNITWIAFGTRLGAIS